MATRAGGGSADPLNVTYHTSEATRESLFAGGSDRYFSGAPRQSSREEILVLAPEGLRDVLAIDATRPARLCIRDKDGECTALSRARVRALLKKVPALLFSSYQFIQFMPTCLVSEAHYKLILDDFIANHQLEEVYDRIILAGYNFTNDIPKSDLYIKMDPEAPQARRDEIANGVRAFFRNDQLFMLDLKVTLAVMDQLLVLFQVLGATIGFIALTLSFFLLLISTTQNIKENIWEYGCLRAVGLTRAQGLRMFLYEQYAVVISAVVIGLVVGLILAVMVSSQLFVLMEFPFELAFPRGYAMSMILLAMTTTLYAVYVPVSAVNRQRIATVIKGTS